MPETEVIEIKDIETGKNCVRKVHERISILLDEERTPADQYKERQVKAINQSKYLEKQIDESKDECSGVKTARSIVQRKFDFNKYYEKLQREINKFYNKIK